MIVKILVNDGGVTRTFVADSAKNPVGFRFSTQQEMARHIMMLDKIIRMPQWNEPVIILPKQTPPAVVEAFADLSSWPVQFYAAEQAPTGMILDAHGNKLSD